MKDEEFTKELSNKMSALIALALAPDIREMKTAEKVELLMRFGISNQEIADIVGTTKGTVEVLKSRAGKKKR